jgi:hypothetical protein
MIRAPMRIFYNFTGIYILYMYSILFKTFPVEVYVKVYVQIKRIK